MSSKPTSSKNNHRRGSGAAVRSGSPATEVREFGISDRLKLSDDEEKLLRDVKRELSVSGSVARRICEANGHTLGSVLCAYQRRRQRRAWEAIGGMFSGKWRVRLYAMVSQVKVMSK